MALLYLCLNCCCVRAMQSNCPLTTPGDVSLANALDKPQSYHNTYEAVIVLLLHGASKLCSIIRFMHRVTLIYHTGNTGWCSINSETCCWTSQWTERPTAPPTSMVGFVTFWWPIAVLALLEAFQHFNVSTAFFFLLELLFFLSSNSQDVSTTLMFDIMGGEQCYWWYCLPWTKQSGRCSSHNCLPYQGGSQWHGRHRKLWRSENATWELTSGYKYGHHFRYPALYI